MSRQAGPVIPRFMAKVKITESCWIWTAAKDDRGYGRIGFRGRTSKAHRVAWTILCGPIPRGMWILHKCDTPACVNPDHLFVGTALDNSRDMVAKRRAQYGERHWTNRLRDRVRTGARHWTAEQGSSQLPRGENHWAHKHPEKVRKGRDCPSARLSEESVLAIRASHDLQSVLAERYGVAQPTISNIVIGKTWKHVKP